MEKTEKQRKKRVDLEFYTTVIEKMGTEVVTTNQLYKIIDEVEEELGLEHEQNRRVRTAKKLEELLGDFIVVENDPSAKSHGRQKPKTYLVSENWRKHFAEKKKESKTREKEHKGRPSEKKLEKTREWMQQVYSMLILANNINQEFRLEDLKEGLHQNISGKTLERVWPMTAKEYGIELEIKQSSFGKRNTTYRVCNKNLKSAFGTLNEAYKNLFKESLPNIGFHMDFKGPGQNIQKKEERLIVDTKEAGAKNMPLIYYIAALIKHEGKALPVMDIAKTLSKRGKTYFTEDILNAIKPAGTLFRLSSHKDYLSLDGETGWLAIQDKYYPKKFVKYEVIARISLPQKSMKRFGVDAEVISEISENDNIYRINVSYLEHDLFDVVRLIDFIDLQQEIGRSDRILSSSDEFINEIKAMRGDIVASYASGSTYFLLECEK